jgi:MFS family permease
MREIINLVSNYLLGDLSPFSKHTGLISLRFISNLGAVFFLVFGYVLGCRALYHYLEPEWGEVYAFLALCALLLTTSLILFLIGWYQKPKEPPIKEFLTNLESGLKDMPNSEFAKKVLSQLSPKTVAALFAFVAVSSYLMKSKNRP